MPQQMPCMTMMTLCISYMAGAVLMRLPRLHLILQKRSALLTTLNIAPDCVGYVERESKRSAASKHARRKNRFLY